MSTIVRLPVHKRYNCDCDSSDCRFCCRGDYRCEVCGGDGDSLPTDCPGEALTLVEANQVEEGRLDYRRRTGWHRPAPRRIECR